MSRALACQLLALLRESLCVVLSYLPVGLDGWGTEHPLRPRRQPL